MTRPAGPINIEEIEMYGSRPLAAGLTDEEYQIHITAIGAEINRWLMTLSSRYHTLPRYRKLENIRHVKKMAADIEDTILAHQGVDR